MFQKVLTAVCSGVVFLSACARGPAPSVLYEERLSRMESRIKQLEQRYEPPAEETRLSVPASLSQKELNSMLAETTAFRKLLAQYPVDTFTGKLRIQELRARATVLDAKIKATEVEKNMALKRERQLYLYQEFQQLRNDMAAIPQKIAATMDATQKETPPVPPLAAPGRSTLSVAPATGNDAMKHLPPQTKPQPVIITTEGTSKSAAPMPPIAAPVPAPRPQRGDSLAPPLPDDPGKFAPIPIAPPQTSTPPVAAPATSVAPMPAPSQPVSVPRPQRGDSLAPPLPDDPGKFAPIPITPPIAVPKEMPHPSHLEIPEKNKAASPTTIP